MAERTGAGLLLFQLSRFSGLNRRISKFLIDDAQCQDIVNFTFDERGALSKLTGFTKWNSTSLGTSKMLGGDRFYATGITPHFIEAHNGTLQRGADVSQTFTQIESGLSTTAKYRMKINRDLIFMLNGTDFNRKYGTSYVASAAVVVGGTGYAVNNILTILGGTFTTQAQLRVTAVAAGVITTVSVEKQGAYTILPANPVSVTGGAGTGATFNITWTEVTRMGIVAPTTAPTAADNGAGVLSSGDYFWKITFVSATHESNGSPVSNTLTLAANRQALLTSVPTSTDTQVSKRRIYRTLAGGTDPKFVGEIADNTATTFADNVADASLGADIPFDKNPPPLGKFIEAFKNRLWISGDVLNPRRLYFSEYFEPEAWPLTFFVDIPMTPGDEVTAIKVLGDVLIVYGHNTPFLVIGETPFDFTVKRSFAQTGTESDRTVQLVENAHIYLSRFGVYAFDGAVGRLISDDIDPLIRDINSTFISNSASGYHDKRKIYRLAVPTAASTTNNRECMYDLRNSAWFLTDRTIEYYHHLDGPGDTGNLFSASPTAGFLFQEDNGETADGANMALKWASKAYTLGVIDFTKYARHILLWSTPNEYPFTLAVEFDDDSAHAQTFTIPASSALPVYGTGVYGTAVYGGPGIVRTVNVFGNKIFGRYMEIAIEATAANKALKIYNIELSYRALTHLRIR